MHTQQCENEYTTTVRRSSKEWLRDVGLLPQTHSMEMEDRARVVVSPQ